MALGTVQLGNNAVQAVTLTNSGNVPLSIGTVSSSPSVFAVTNNCGASVAAGASCAFQVTFTPSAAGTFNGSLSIATTASAQPSVIALSATAIAQPMPAASFSSGVLSFGDAVLGSPASMQTVNLTNAGPGSLLVQSVAVAGPHSGDFSANGCATGTSVAAGGSCAIEVAFNPQAAGARTATLTVSGSLGTVVSAALNAKALGSPAEALNLSASAIDFGTLPTSATGQTQKLTLTNTSTTAIALTSVAVPAPFKLEASGTCSLAPFSLAAGASCTIDVSYAPTGAGKANGEMQIQVQSAASPVTVALSANVVPGNVGAGGCSVGSNDRPDPLLWLLTLLAGAGLWIGRRRPGFMKKQS